MGSFRLRVPPCQVALSRLVVALLLLAFGSSTTRIGDQRAQEFKLLLYKKEEVGSLATSLQHS